MKLKLKAFDVFGERVFENDPDMNNVEDWNPADVTALGSSSFDGTVFGLFAEDIALALAKGAYRVIVTREDS